VPNSRGSARERKLKLGCLSNNCRTSLLVPSLRRRRNLSNFPPENGVGVPFLVYRWGFPIAATGSLALDFMNTLKKPEDIIQMLRTFSVADIRDQLEKDSEERVSRYILVSEFIQDIADAKKAQTVV
jgi:hypothetical protein